MTAHKAAFQHNREGNFMQDISYTSKLIHAEDGRPLALDYYT